MKRYAALLLYCLVSAARADLPSVRFDRMTPLGAAAGATVEVEIAGADVEGVETLLFDLGKVLVDYDFEPAMQHFAARSPLPHDTFRSVILDHRWIYQYETGAISTADYHRYLQNAGELEMTFEEFHDTWTAVFLPDLIVPEELLAP